MIVWLDLETTGLDPATERILELGMVVTTNQLYELGRRNWVLHYKRSPRIRIDPVVAEMHMANGLWPECEASRQGNATAATEAIEWLRNLGVPEGRTPLAGNSVGFDRAFLATHMPSLAQYFHYRNIDVSSLNELCKRWNSPLYQLLPQVDGRHRALSDLDDSIASARFYKDFLFTGDGYGGD